MKERKEQLASADGPERPVPGRVRVDDASRWVGSRVILIYIACCYLHTSSCISRRKKKMTMTQVGEGRRAGRRSRRAPKRLSATQYIYASKPSIHSVNSNTPPRAPPRNVPPKRACAFRHLPCAVVDYLLSHLARRSGRPLSLPIPRRAEGGLSMLSCIRSGRPLRTPLLCDCTLPSFCSCRRYYAPRV